MSELCQLYRIKKIKTKKYKIATEIIEAIEKDLNIKILSFSKEHISTLAKLTITKEHNDPTDHAIVSHAITKKLVLVSPDKKFTHYIKQHLPFMFNKR